ncbi:SGNH/GDSL hydrolase family protein [Verrucomicrobiota bacterium]
MVEPGRHSREPAEARPKSPTTVFFLLLPAVLHIAALVVSLARPGSFSFTKLDIGFFLAFCSYLSIVALVSRKAELAKKFTLLVYSVLLPILAVELVASLPGVGKHLNQPRQPLRSVAVAANTMPGIAGEISFTINDDGIRAPDFWPGSPDDRILCIGGSTTECLYVTDTKSWPWLLGTMLTEAVGRPILVANAGLSGQFTLHHAYQLRHYRLADQFGTVIVLCGINDAGTMHRENYEERAAAVPLEALSSPCGIGAYYRYSFLMSKIYPLFRPRSAFRSVAQDPAGKWYAGARETRTRRLEANTITSAPNTVAPRLRTYRANLIDIIELCSGRGQRLVFATQPTLYHKDMPNDLAALLWQHTEDGAHTPEVLAEVMAQYNAVMRTVCKEYAVPCVDLALLLPKDTSVFYDDCHFNTSGCKKIAEIMAPIVQKELR